MNQGSQPCEGAPSPGLAPPPPGFSEGQLTGARVIAQLADHVTVDGRFVEMTPDAALIQEASADRPRRIPLDELQYLLFVQPLRMEGEVRAIATTHFTIQFRDGARLSGQAIARSSDASGDQIFRCFQGEVRRLFIPRCQLGQPDSVAPDTIPVCDVAIPDIRTQASLAAWMRQSATTSSLASTCAPAIDLNEIILEDEAVQAISSDIARRYSMIPVAQRRSVIAVAMANPGNGEAVRTVEFATGRRVLPMQATVKAIHDAIHRCYDESEDRELLSQLKLRDYAAIRQESAEHIERLASQRPIVGIVNQLILEAIHRRASDIHIRPNEEDFEVLYRIDGTLVPVRRFNRALLAAIVSRIKVLGDMDITERRRPQDGRAAFTEQDVVVDLRISVIPTVSGESVVIRLLNAREGIRSLSQLGLGPDDERRLREVLDRSYGMMLVTGPTGSGKSTTLYASLLELRKRNVNIITVENPVEYYIDDIEQIQVNAPIGFTFARALRNILRHDPDVVMVGEIRDQETAEIAVESALTGHLILSTLHTNDAVTTITRLLDLDIQPFLLKSTLLAVLAQRLVRRNCPHCLVEESVDAAMRQSLGIAADDRFFVGAGCEHCDGLGRYGRTAVYELLVVTPALRELVVADADATLLQQQAIADGMVPLTANALALARQKVISLSEVVRIRTESYQ